APGIQRAGYKDERIDRVEHSNRIDDEIVAWIRKSKFVVADCTGHRGGVYYEAGFAHGLGIPVIWTVRADQLDQVHFDTRQYNFIQWTEGDFEELTKRVAIRIESVVGRGPVQYP